MIICSNPYVAYFDHVAAFEALYLSLSGKGGAHTQRIIAAISPATMCVYPLLLEVQRYSTPNTTTRSKSDRIMFVFYPGLSHIDYNPTTNFGILELRSLFPLVAGLEEPAEGLCELPSQLLPIVM